MKQLFTLFTFISLIVFLGACSSSKSLPSTDEGDIPEWYLNIPEDPNFLYAANSGTSKDMDLAVQKASTDARAEIGRQMELKVNALQKKFAEEVGTGDNSQLLEQFTTATKTVVSTELTGSKIAKKSIQKDGNNFRAYVLAEYPIGAAQQAFMKQISKNEELYTRFRSGEAFKELEEDVKKYEDWKKNQ